MSHSSEKKGSSSDTAPKRIFFFQFFLSLGKIKWPVSFRTERKMQVPQSERSLISGSHPSHVLCVFQTDLTLPGFYSTDSGNKPRFATETNSNMFKITRFCCTFVSERAQGSKGKCLHYLTCELFLSCWWAKAGVEWAIFSIF